MSHPSPRFGARIYDENARLNLLLSLGVLDTPAEPEFDDLTYLAQEFCETPMAAISLIDNDRQWFKSKSGINFDSSPREDAFCTYTISQEKPLVVNDASHDERFYDNPFVTGAPFIRFYAGAPILVDGYPLGSVCVIDTEPREISKKHLRILRILAAQASANLKKRQLEKVCEQTEAQLAKHRLQAVTSSKFSTLGEIASGIAHEINNPLAVITLRTNRLLELVDHGPIEPQKIRDIGVQIQTFARRIATIVQAIRSFSRDDEHESLKDISINHILEETLKLLKEKLSSVQLNIDNIAGDAIVHCHPIQISQVVTNLLSNAVDAVQDSIEKWIRLEVVSIDDEIEISVTDSGPGIPSSVRERIMEPFFTTKPVGRGTGIGLSLSSKILQSHGSLLQLDPLPRPTRFFFRLKVKSKS